MPHPLDLNYELLKAGLSHLDKRGDEFGVIQTYLKSTEPQWRKIEIQDVWAVDREGEVVSSGPVGLLPSHPLSPLSTE